MVKKKFQYSKILPLITFALFCGCVIKCFTVDISNAYDISIYATIVTVSGALNLTTNVWYMKNSQAEKVARIQSEIYKIISEERFKYNEKMLALKSKYKYSDEDILEIENDSPLDELEQDALSRLNSFVNNTMDEATSSIEVQNI